MTDHPSIITRIAIGKLLGFTFGLIVFLIIPFIAPETPLMLRIGIVLWYATLGAIIGVFGIFTWNPVLQFPLPWWLRSTMIGAWMNFVLVLIAYKELQIMIFTIFGENGLYVSPFWLVLEGAIVGVVIGYFATKFGGEGEETVTEEEELL
ncbi:MAG: hypothetical protein ACJA0S_001174 [Rickettsiales bacterium]|jgi:hypothetical protein